MEPWQLAALVFVVLLVGAGVALGIWLRRSGLGMKQAPVEFRALAKDIVRLPGRLRRLAADHRVPRRARWMLIGLALYVASPIDLIPDFLPGIGQLDDAIIIPLVLIHIRRMIPRDVWDEYFPGRPQSSDWIEDPR